MTSPPFDFLLKSDIPKKENGMSLLNSVSSSTKTETPEKNQYSPLSNENCINDNNINTVYFNLTPENNCTFLQNEVTNLELKLRNSESEKENLLKENKRLHSELSHLNDIKNNFNIELTKEVRKNKAQYEKMLNDKEKEHEIELYELNKTMTQLKEIFENEKSNYETKIESIRKQELKIRQDLIKEYEDKIKETEQNNQDDIEQLQFINEELQAKYNCLLVSTEHNMKILNQQLQTSDKVNQENKSNLIELTKLHNADLEEQLKQFDNERNNYKDKVIKYQNEIHQYKTKIDSLLKQLTDKENTIQIKINEIKNNKISFEQTIHSLLERFDSYKTKQTEINSEYNLKQQDYSRETMLLHQQIDFLNTKLETIILLKEQKEKEHLQYITQLKIDLENEFNIKLNELIQEKNNLLSTIETNLSKIDSLNNELKQTTSMYENKIYKLQYDNTIQCDLLRNKINAFTKENDKLHKEINTLNKRIEKLNENVLKLENENLDLKSSMVFLEKDKKENYIKINELLIQKEELINNNEELKGDIEQLRKHLQIKNQNCTINLKKRKHNSMRRKNSSQSLIAISSSTTEHQTHKKVTISSISNLSAADTASYSDLIINGNNNIYNKRNICKSNRRLENFIKRSDIDTIIKKGLV